MLGELSESEDDFSNCEFIRENLNNVILIQKTYSLGVLLLFFIFLIFKKKTDPEYFSRLVKNSVFSLLKDYYKLKYKDSEFDTISISLKENGNEHSLQKENIFDFFNISVCINLSCPEFLCAPFTRLKARCWTPLKIWFWKRSHFMLFHLVIFGFLFYSTIEYIFGFLISPCLESSFSILIYAIIDLLTTSFSFFTFGFMISFIASRRELQSLHPNDRKAKTLLFYYHVQKGFMFAFVVFLMKFALFGVSFSSGNYSGTTFFNISLNAVSNLYYLERGLLFFMIIRRSHSQKRVHLNCHCDLIKQEAKFHHIQNFMLKNRANVNEMLMQVQAKNGEELLENYRSILQVYVNTKVTIYRDMIKTIDEQKFKNVLVKKNFDSSYHRILAWVFYFYFFLSIILTILIILTLSPAFKGNCSLNGLSVFGFILLDMTEIFCFPFLFMKTTRKTGLI